jgi:carbon starvation protein
MKLTHKIGWLLLAVLGALALGQIALVRGESINSVWLLIAAVCIYLIAYRFYARFIGNRVLGLDDRRATPAWVHNDGKDYVPTPKGVLFGHHFAAIAGAGPLVGPVLAAQMGYLPGTLWILAGVVFAGAVQDFVILFASTRRDGKSLGEMAKQEVGRFGGLLASVAILSIMTILIAVLALVVVNALKGSPWGTFTLAMTIPIAILMGLYMRYLRPGRVEEATVIGIVLLLAALVLGERVAASPTWAPLFTFDGQQLALMLMAYAFVASVLPVWVLLAPRDYLSTFLKLGTIVLLALGILWVRPELQMPALTQFIDGSGPVFAGNLFPFLFITIACGAVSGFHALVASGTTPKMVQRESELPILGYGGMLAESFVAIMAMIAASVLSPGVYFAVNSPPAAIGTAPEAAAATISSWGFTVTSGQLTGLASEVGESTILSRTGGAPSLALGMAQIFSSAWGAHLMAFFYHFAILFEAVFILTTVDAGTRVGRFVLQDLLGNLWPKFGDTRWYPGNLLASFLIVAGWGYFLYQGVTDPLGGINTLWPLFGISNQMLAALALALATTILLRMGKTRYLWVTLLPLSWLLVVTMTAGYQKIFSQEARVGFLAHAELVRAALARGELLAPAQNLAQMRQMLFNDTLDALVTGIFMLVVILVMANAIYTWLRVWRRGEHTVHESPYLPLESFVKEPR